MRELYAPAYQTDDGMTDEEFTEYFLKKFPQFEGVKDKVADYYNQARCRFPVLNNVHFCGSINRCDDYNRLNAACLVVAHYLTVYEVPEDAAAGSAGNGGGIVNSASVGDVSVGMQLKPINDMFEDFMASTVYGRDFLAWLASVGGITLIN